MDSKFKNKIISALRKLSYTWQPRLNVRKRAKRAPATYECELCKYWCYEGKSEKNFEKLKEEFPDKKIKMEALRDDHIEPVRDVKDGFVDWNTFIERMYCEEENFQTICKSCHAVKTKKETEERKKWRAKKKNV